MARRKRVIYSKASVFHDLGLKDADDLVLRADLMQRVCAIIESRGLTQAQAAGVMGMDQPRVSALMRGKINKFSTDRLFRALSDLGQNIEVRISPAHAKRGRMLLAA
ncbi:MAG: XRE family transcriptional regulator [Alphaproteobacteria bacterium]|nr:XRE family transcriptional regulator [Alphaproteobacteria bacterium]